MRMRTKREASLYHQQALVLVALLALEASGMREVALI
jgi:hypothetical protein